MGFFKSVLKAALEYDDKEEARTRDRDKRHEEIKASIQRHHEVTAHNYYRSQVIRENQERRRKGQPEIPVPAFRCD